MSPSCEVQVRFHAPPAPLRRYFTTFYLVEWQVEGGGRITDYLMPEWANLRFHSGDTPVAETLSGQRLEASPFPVTGPSTKAVRFSIGSMRMWGIGLLPLGWAKFIGACAADYANSLRDGLADPAFANFVPLARSLFSSKPDETGELERIGRHFLARIDDPVEDERRIVAIHSALVDPEVSTVAQMVAKSGASQRTVERTCRRAFGFAPKLLLRRQRFMRSLSKFMLDPTMKWIGAIDSHYHDQAQFVRDFRQFIGMSPRQFAAQPKQLIGAIMRERARIAGSAAQTLDSPSGMADLP